jgi:DHA2 family multidrug resistance protein
MRSLYTPDADFRALVMPMLVQGVGMSVFFIAMVTLVLNGVPGSQVPAASGLSNFARITTGGFAASIATTLWDRTAALHQTRLSEVMGAHDPAFTGALRTLQGAGLSAQQALGSVTQQVTNQAYLLATLDLFRLSAWLILLLIPCVWLTRRAIASGEHAAGAD